MWRSGLSAGGLAVVLTTVSAARADAPLDTIYEQAKSELKSGEHDAATRTFREGLTRAAEGPERWRFRLGLALSRELAGDRVLALTHYRRFLRASMDDDRARVHPWPQRRAQAELDIAELETHVMETHGRLEVTSAPAGATVMIDGAEDPSLPTPGAWYLPEGTVRVVVRMRGYGWWRETVVVTAGRADTIEVSLVASQSLALAPSVRSATSTPPPFHPLRTTTIVSPGLRPLAVGGYAAIGVGAASLVAATGLTLATSSSVDELRALRDQPATQAVVGREAALYDRIAVLQRAYGSLYVIGGLTAAAGAGMVLYDATSDDESDDAAGPQFRLGPGHLFVRGAF